MDREQAQRALVRAQAAGWDKSGQGRVLLGILARRAAGQTRQQTPEEILRRAAERRQAMRARG